MKNNNSNPKKFLDIQELSALENETVKGGRDIEVESKKEKKKEK